ncbi:hotdog domain-containing protein [Gracilimonas mengyeensis]|uniref:Acyl-CoA hydrolase n=1 Tax=Gracilimonas mengyeensis TaxID=1302730 RepID=A0A521FD64_9BACT|nr:hotdog domain-containing protein [Gracilimonas mengyeensis]SMO94099.1 Acyl-CoA hydrolase [Gracilimonas mengyeensis]
MRPVDTSKSRVLKFSSDENLRRRFMIVDKDIPGNLRWGKLLEELDKLAEDIALEYVHRINENAKVVTAAIDDIMLRTPVDIHRDLNLHARINYVGRTSMEVGIRVDQDGEEGDSLASCYFTMVARLEKDGKAKSLPIDPLEYEDELEKKRYESAIARRKEYRNQMDALQQPPSKEEYAMLRNIHQAQEEPGFDGLLAGDLVRGNWERMFPEHENVPKKIFGGYVIRRAFELAMMHAEEITPNRPVFVRVNRINFYNPVRIGDKLDFTSRITYTGNTSLSIEISIERISHDQVVRALSNVCTFTFVNVDEEMNPKPVPEIYPTTYAEDERYLKAHRRRLEYKKWRERTQG